MHPVAAPMTASTGTLWWLPRILGHDTLDPTETLLLIGLADHVNADDECFVGIRTLAKYARISYATARRRLAVLEERQIIERAQRCRPDGGDSVYDYRLVRAAFELDPPAQNERGAELDLSGGPRSSGRAGGRAHPDERAEVPPVEPPREKSTARCEQPRLLELADRFDDFWSVYPHKAGKGQARPAWKRAAAKADPDEIIAGAARYRDDPERDPSFTKHPSTWLNGECWNDPPLPARGGMPKRSAREQRISGRPDGPARFAEALGHPAPVAAGDDMLDGPAALPPGGSP